MDQEKIGWIKKATKGRPKVAKVVFLKLVLPHFHA
jgi:hypothetical protein